MASEIEENQRNGIEMEKVTLKYPKMTVEEAYDVQSQTIQRYRDRGDEMVGWKMGLTSVAKQKSMNVEEPIYGRLTNSMKLSTPTLKMENLIHPKVEPEFAFLINKELKGDQLQVKDVWEATKEVYPALEIIDSRYKNFSFTLTDVIADNASSSKFILGKEGFPPEYTDWDNVKVTMFVNGDEVQSGYGKAVLDHPVNSIIELSKMLNRTGLSIKPGMIVLVGAITEAVSVKKGDYLEVNYETLGQLNLNVTD
ncbi:4-oxalocrotonate decarboxylase [Salicibibacter kimchii]|uniref:4-oxalocrotonate decarboxylase n=2 Tax=Salicibibacter kimchii TaxID=2099786 RepID=A0A345C464_9BACI|nr:4-oxalocrotonate decarboxylase [Salicibibacter kimchii]